jgi:hypothetical protein
MANIVERTSKSICVDNPNIYIGIEENMGVMKGIYTAYHLRGKAAFAGRPKLERQLLEGFIKRRHESPAKVEVIGDYIVMLGELVREPVFDGNYLVIDITTHDQRLVKLDHANSAWYVYEIGSSVRRTLADFDQRYYRWVHIHPLTKDVMNEVSAISNSTKPA